ncbi:GTP-binding protein [Gluconacetobacter tumulicola]|uniref:GTP-binding protein n=1 Tax=Gluconacetobacter tumulicola TaxID=1017177 RepID=A0A7W4JCY7_9PROT|nr:GTP-binding protein [Gluconacetobacter tumulicola]
MTGTAAAVPITIIGGFLGAGKTTLLNRIVTAQAARRLAVIVNDFGAIDIDGELIARRGEDVLALRNGCICCSLQGDLLGMLRRLLARDPPPEGIFVECSGVSRLDDMRRALLDPVIWAHVSFEGIVCVTDAEALAEAGPVTRDPLFLEQIHAADLIVLSHADRLEAEAVDRAEHALHAIRPGVAIARDGARLLAHPALRAAAALAPRVRALRASAGEVAADPEFASLAWRSDAPIDVMSFRTVLERHAPGLLRAKGILYAASAPYRGMLLQMVGMRATVGPAPERALADRSTRIVFIGRRGTFDPASLLRDLDALPAPLRTTRILK